ncbi:hypothetical protein N665_0381s0005 [Sinapis alba]|nr:hypothetical protein N665_0381s0005 [Sinapis alba]
MSWSSYLPTVVFNGCSSWRFVLMWLLGEEAAFVLWYVLGCRGEPFLAVVGNRSWRSSSNSNNVRLKSLSRSYLLPTLLSSTSPADYHVSLLYAR